MKRISLVAVAALVAGLVTVAAPAQADPTPDEQLSASWLADEVPESGLFTFTGSTFIDHGLSIDVLVALTDLDAEAPTRNRIADALEDSVDAYTTPGEFGAPGDRYAGQVGKLAAALQLAGRAVTDIDGDDLVAITESTVVQDAGDRQGRAVNIPAADDFNNAIGQSWVVRALAAADSDLADETAGYLARQQCADGSLVEDLVDAGCTTGTGQIDATAFALRAFVVARDNGVTGLDEEIADAAAYLLAEQNADGSFSGPTPNTNTTGLAAQALQSVGTPASLAGAAEAAGWVYDKQVTAARAGSTPLADDIGAIAFDQAALDAARPNGIAAANRDQFRRATAQAVLALPAADLEVTGPGVAGVGETVEVEVSRLDAEEPFTVTVGDETGEGTADAQGDGTAEVALPDDEGQAAVTARGTESGRTGTDAVTVLGPAEFDVLVDPEVARPGQEVEVSFGDSAPADDEPVSLAVVPADELEELFGDASTDEEPAGVQPLSSADVRALQDESVVVVAGESLDAVTIEAPEDVGAYAVVVLSAVPDRGGLTDLDVVAAGTAEGGDGAAGPVGTGSGVGAGASDLPDAGSSLPVWLAWLAALAVAVGAVLTGVGLGRPRRS